MIGQIDIEKSLLNAPNDRSLFVAVASVVNSLVDVVNELQQKVVISKMEKVELADPYTNQRKWIGCVCRFWYDNPNDTLLDYLDKIQTGKNGVVQYYAKESGDWFPHCEPVLPIDNAIYKGGDNE